MLVFLQVLLVAMESVHSTAALRVLSQSAEDLAAALLSCMHAAPAPGMPLTRERHFLVVLLCSTVVEPQAYLCTKNSVEAQSGQSEYLTHSLSQSAYVWGLCMCSSGSSLAMHGTALPGITHGTCFRD